MTENEIENKFSKKLDDDKANEILSNILVSINKEESRVPLDVLSSYAEYHPHKHLFARISVIFLIVILLLIPLLLVTPKFDVTETKDSSSNLTTYEISISSIFPIKDVEASLDGKEMSLQETDNGNYIFRPLDEGTIQVTVTLINGQYKTWEKDIDEIDTDNPEYIRLVRNADKVYVYAKDSGSGLDYNNSYAVLEDGTKVQPVSAKDECFEFIFENNMNIYILDNKGNKLQIVLTGN